MTKRVRTFAVQLTRIGLAFAASFFLVQVATNFVSGGHTSGPGRVCGPDGEYYHLHWERVNGVSNDRTVYYTPIIVDEWGATGQYEPQIVYGVGNYNSGQSFVTFNYSAQAPSEVIAVAGDYRHLPYQPMGATIWNPEQCGSPIEGTSTHGVDDGNTAVLLSTPVIEVGTATERERRRKWTINHEFGHAIGLGHDNDNPSTRVMYAYTSSSPLAPQTGDFNSLTGNPLDDSGLYSDPYGHIH